MSSEASAAQSGYKIIIADMSSPESLAKSYNDAISEGQVVASVWDGSNVNIIIRRGTTGGTGKSYRAFPINPGTPEELERALTEITHDGSHVVSTVWDGQRINVITEIEYI